MVPRLDARPTPGCGGATGTRRPRSPTPSWSPRTGAAAGSTPSTSCSTPASSTTTATGTSPSTTPRRRPTTSCIRLTRPQRRARGGDAPRPARRCGSATRGRGGLDDREPADHGGEDGAARRPSTRPRADGAARRRRRRDPLVCDNETNAARLWGVAGATPYPKDGIGDHVVHGAATVNPDGSRHQGARCGTCSTSPAGGDAPRSVCGSRPDGDDARATALRRA